jgi:hypothetical protein
MRIAFFPGIPLQSGSKPDGLLRLGDERQHDTEGYAR